MDLFSNLNKTNNKSEEFPHNTALWSNYYVTAIFVGQTINSKQDNNWLQYLFTVGDAILSRAITIKTYKGGSEESTEKFYYVLIIFTKRREI